MPPFDAARPAAPRRPRCRAAIALSLAAALSVTMPAVDAAPSGGAGKQAFKEVGQLPVLGGDLSAMSAANSGWLILSRRTRRAYQLLEKFNTTIVQSFDLDTLEPLRRVTLTNEIPVIGGNGSSSAGVAALSGEAVHAVDEQAGRLYFAMSNIPVPVGAGLDPHERRTFTHVLAIDEAAFDRGASVFAARFTIPNGPQLRFHAYALMGMALSRRHVADGEPGRLLAVFAAPGRLSNAPVFGTPIPGAYDHTLVQWDPASLAFNGGVGVGPVQRLGTDWEHVLVSCATAPLRSIGSPDVNPAAATYQWGILATANAVLTGCQSAPQSGAVVHVAVDADGRPTGVINESIHPVAAPVTDVLVDEGGERLLLRSPHGTVFLVFSVASMRATGSVVVARDVSLNVAAGVDPAGGRLYALVPHHSGRDGLVQGGLHVGDTRANPTRTVNAAPALAYPASFRIQVDPTTRRVFVRRGTTLEQTMPAYPSGEPVATPPELFYRVLQDRT